MTARRTVGRPHAKEVGVRLRVCLVSAEYPPETAAGGVGTYTRDLAHGLVALGHEVTVISAPAPGAGESDEDRQGVRVVRVSPHRSLRRHLRGRGRASLVRGLVARSDRVVEAVHECGPFDVIEAPLWNGEMASWSSSEPTPLVTRLVTPVFVSMQVLGAPPALALEQLERRQCMASTCLAAISRSIADLVVGHYGLATIEVLPSPLGIPLPTLPRTRPPGPPRLLYVGRLERRKGVETLLQALPKVLDACPEAHVDLVGVDTGQAGADKTYEEMCKGLLGPVRSKRVRFHGYVTDQQLDALYSGATAFVAPSLYESFGLVFLEALGRGVAVVGTTVGGVPEIVDDRVGRLVPPGEPPALAAACIELLSDHPLARRLGEAGRARVAAEFSESTMARGAANVYERAIAVR